MSNKRTSLRVTFWLIAFSAVLVVLLRSTATVADACMAINLPDVRVIKQAAPAAVTGRAGQLTQRVRYVAFFSEYNCAAMPPKTFCALGLCLRPSPEVRKANIQVDMMRFVDKQGQPIPGFDPKPNAVTSQSFRERKAGVWYGFASLFQRKFDREGGVEVKVEFSAAPGTSDDAIRAILAESFIGAAGGNKDGRVVEGHHLEIVKANKVTIVGEKAAAVNSAGQVTAKQ